MSKVVLVTGTSSGLGVSIAVQAARAGCVVHASMRDLAKQDLLMHAAGRANVSLNVVELDVTEAQQVDHVIEGIIGEHGRIDCVVANAGIGYVRPTEQAAESEIQHVLNTNFMGVVRCVKSALPHMRSQGAGHFIAVSSVGGLVGQPFNEFYCASKFALEGYFESLATYVTQSFGINFTLVEPGGIESEFANSILKGVKETGGFPDDVYKPLLERYIGGRSTRNVEGVIQSADEVASVVVECVKSASPPVRVRTSPWSEEFSSLKTKPDPDGTIAQAMVFNSMLGSG